MSVQAFTSTLLSLVVTLLVGSVHASTDTSNRVRSSIAESEEFERNREQIEQEWKEEERRIKAGEELPAEMDLDAASATEAPREVSQNQRLSRYFFPWGVVASFALCAFLYWRPKLLPPFFYRQLWLTVTLIGMAILWWPVIFMLYVTDAGNGDMIPKMIGDSVSLILVIALGYGLFLLSRKHIKPVV